MADPTAVVWGGFGAVPIIIGLVQALKLAGFPTRYAALASYALGAIGGVVFGAAELIPWSTAVAQGLWVGLAASGLYSGIRRATNGAPHSAAGG